MQQAGASRRGRGFARRSSWLAPRLRQAPLAGLVGAARALRLLRPIRVGTLSTVEPEKAAVRARRAPIAAQGRPPDLMRLPHDARRPPRGAHAIRAAQLSLARLIQECAPRGRELLSPRGPWGSAGWTPPGTWSRALKTGGIGYRNGGDVVMNWNGGDIGFNAGLFFRHRPANSLKLDLQSPARGTRGTPA